MGRADCTVFAAGDLQSRFSTNKDGKGNVGYDTANYLRRHP